LLYDVNRQYDVYLTFCTLAGAPLFLGVLATFLPAFFDIACTELS
jgi:hypothetical protein